MFQNWHDQKSDFIDYSIALTLYKSLVLSHLDYCDTLHMTSKQEDLNKLQIAQNVACRTLLLPNKHEHIDTMHNQLKLEKLETRRKFHLGDLCFKNVHCGTEKTGIHDHFIRQDTSGRLTTKTATCNVDIPMVRSVIGRKVVSFCGPSF